MIFFLIRINKLKNCLVIQLAINNIILTYLWKANVLWFICMVNTSINLNFQHIRIIRNQNTFGFEQTLILCSFVLLLFGCKSIRYLSPVKPFHVVGFIQRNVFIFLTSLRAFIYCMRIQNGRRWVTDRQVFWDPHILQYETLQYFHTIHEKYPYNAIFHHTDICIIHLMNISKRIHQFY